MAGEQAIFSIQRDRAHRSLDTVSIHLDAAVVEETYEAVPVVEAIADRLRDGALLRDGGQPGLEPSPELFHQRLRFGLSDGATFLRAAAADPALDGIECRDPFQRLVGDRRRTAFVDIEEVAPPVQPAESERHRASITPRISQLFVDRIAVALHDAGIACQQSKRVLAAAAGRIGIGDARRVGPTPRPVVPRDRPEVAGLGPAPAGIEHGSPRLIDRDLGRAEQDLLHAQIDRLELRRCDANPKGQRGAVDRQALQLHDLRLPVKRIVPGELIDHDAGHETFGRNTALDQALRSRRLDDRAFADPAAIFGTMRNDHLVLGRNLVETL
jgi:hypothetical protein